MSKDLNNIVYLNQVQTHQQSKVDETEYHAALDNWLATKADVGPHEVAGFGRTAHSHKAVACATTGQVQLDARRARQPANCTRATCIADACFALIATTAACIQRISLLSACLCLEHVPMACREDSQRHVLLPCMPLQLATSAWHVESHMWPHGTRAARLG